MLPLSNSHRLCTKQIVVQALRCWHTLEPLGHSPLARLNLTAVHLARHNYPHDPIGYGMAVRSVLRTKLEQLQPAKPANDTLYQQLALPSQVAYRLLKMRYIDQNSPRLVQDCLNLTERTYYRYHARAIAQLCSLLQEAEILHTLKE